MRVAVVGGGVVGLCIAEALSRRGAEVVLLEAGELGAGASAGNAGWVTPGISNPLPAPGLMPQAIRWMLNPRSPLLVRPVLRPDFLRWLWDFWRATGRYRYVAGMTALLSLSSRVLADFDALAARCSFEMHRQGLLFVARSEGTLQAELEVLREQQMLGYAGGVSVLTREEALAHEPALAPAVAGGVFAGAERHVRPESLTRGLVERLRADRVELRERAAAHGLHSDNGRWAVDCDGGIELADSVVLACGVSAANLLRPLGVRLPLEGAKGYSLTLADPPIRPRGPIYLLEARVAVSPYEGALRLAGTLELGSRRDAVSSGRVASIGRAGRSWLRGLDDRAEWKAWAGFRPMLPDGLPAIGPVPGRPGIHVATGHAMLGITHAPTTAEVLAPLVLGEAPALQLAPFSVARFGNLA